MKWLILLGLTQAYATPLPWTTTAGDSEIGDCDDSNHVHLAMCGLPLPSSGCDASSGNGYSVGALDDGASQKVICSAGFLGRVSVSCTGGAVSVTGSCMTKPAKSNFEDVNLRAQARANLKSSLGTIPVIDLTKTTAQRKSDRKTAKSDRRAQLMAQRGDVSWKDFVVEDDTDYAGYTEKVIAKRRGRPIRYRLAPKVNCDSAELLELQPSSGGLDSVDLEDGGCVKITVVGEDGVVTIEDKNEGDDDDLYDLTCSLGGSSTDAQASDEFTCGGRIWDVGSLTTDTGCVADASDPDGTGCTCNTGFVDVDNDNDGEADACVVAVSGCMTSSACNYNSAATVDDGSCAVEDALGECGGSCAADNNSNGICDDAEVPAGPSTCPEDTSGLSAAEYINAQCCQC